MKKLYVFAFILVALLAFLLVVGAGGADDTPYFELQDGTVIKVSPRYDYIDWARAEINDSVFFPSYADMSNIKIKFNGGVSNIVCNDKSINNGDVVDFSSCATTDSQGASCYKLKIQTNVGTKTYYVYKANSLPAIFVNTSIGGDRLMFDNEKDIQSSITIVNNDNTKEYVEAEGLYSEIRTRGNATKGMLKKPYQIKLGTKTDLFGMGKARTWILLANYMDQSLIRNAVMYHIGSLLGLNTSSFRSVDLFIDNEYQGVYLICEKVQIQSNRVNITDLEEETDLFNPTYNTTAKKVTKGTLIDTTILTEYTYVEGVVNPEDITGGYLVELDNNYYQGELCYFTTKVGDNLNHYVIKSPEYASKEQVEYIAKIFADMEEAMTSDNGYNRNGEYYTEYIDLETLASAYIMAELGKNWDAGSSSMYYYKDVDVDGVRSTIYKGPLWDCDNTLGNIHRNGADDPEGLWAGERFYWQQLLKHDDFKQAVKTAFEGVYEEIIKLMDEGDYIDSLVNDIGTSVYMDRAKWNSYSSKTWPRYDVGVLYDDWQSEKGQFTAISTYTNYVDDTSDTAIGYLMNSLESRANWLAQYWNCDVTIRTRSKTLPANVAEVISLIKSKVKEKVVKIASVCDNIQEIKKCAVITQPEADIKDKITKYTVISTAIDYYNKKRLPEQQK